MQNLICNFHVAWADVDVNAHMRHSAYNDYAAECRVMTFDKVGFNLLHSIKAGYGPVIFREETRFLKEIILNQTFTVELKLKHISKDFRKWAFVHIFKNTEDQITTVLVTEGAWIDLKKRKVIKPPADIISMIEQIPKAEDFEVL